MNPSSRLGPRLNSILELVTLLQQQTPYPYIWDCGCDHGYLGIKILAENLCEKLVFVDQQAHIIEQLSNKLAPFSTGKHELIAADAGELCFDSQHRHLVILAGVGGENMVRIISAMEHKHPDVQIDYIFCPSSNQNALRKYLAAENFGLVFESLTCENRRCYEILFCQGKTATGDLPRVSLSCEMWEADNPDHQHYLNKINAPRHSKKSMSKKLRRKQKALVN